MVLKSYNEVRGNELNKARRRPQCNQPNAVILGIPAKPAELS